MPKAAAWRRPQRLADIVIIAVPYANATEALKGAGDLTGKIVVDISNQITPDYKAPAELLDAAQFSTIRRVLE